MFPRAYPDDVQAAQYVIRFHKVLPGDRSRVFSMPKCMVASKLAFWVHPQHSNMCARRCPFYCLFNLRGVCR